MTGTPSARRAIFITIFSGFLMIDHTSTAWATDSGWSNEITIYGWLTDISGTTKFSDVSGESLSVDTSDIIDDLNMVFMGNYVGKYGRWSLLGDVVYADVGDSATVSTNLGGAATDLDIKSWLLTGAVGYDIVQSDRTVLAVIGGVRYIDLQTDATLSLNGQRLVDASESEGLTDGIIGLRGTFMLGEHWFIPYYADIGAGGTDLSYQLFGGIGYQFGWGDIRLGYRYLDLDFGDDKLMQDLTLGGPALGVGFRF